MALHESACPHGTCDGSGWVYQENGLGQAPDATRCRCLTERVAKRRTTRAERAVPEYYHHVAIDRNPLAQLDARSRRTLKRYVDELDDNVDGGRGLWLTGERGIGKTSAACWLALRAGERNYSVAYHNVGELLDELKTAFRATEEDRTEGAIIHRLVELDLVVLDDLVAGHTSSEWIAGAFYRIVNGRHDRMKATIVTADVDRDELANLIGWRTVRRLDVICGPPLELTHGPDLRAVGE